MRRDKESVLAVQSLLDKQVTELAQFTSKLTDFYAYLPEHRYIHLPTRELWPASSVDGRVQPWPTGSNGNRIRPSRYLDLNRAVEQMTWAPGLPMIIKDQVVQAGGWARHEGASVFNLYRAPNAYRLTPGSADDHEQWVAHIREIYPSDADHIIRWLAHRVQYPGVKVNHALVLGGSQGIGKDTILEPVKSTIGSWNWSDINPDQMIRRFNGWAKAVVVRVSEARDLGEVDRFAFYDHSKTYIAAPPDVIRCDEKNLREHYVANVMGVIITTNHKTDGLFLPADDRRHYVAWSDVERDRFSDGYWRALWHWYLNGGGICAVAHYLENLDISDFDPKAPPPKTEAFFAITQANAAPEDSELSDAIERAALEAVTIEILVENAHACGLSGLVDALRDRRQRRSLPHRLERVGFVPVRNQNASDGLWKMRGKRQAIYADKRLCFADQMRAAQSLARKA